MKEKDIQNDLSAIRNLMERSNKFISLSGLAGILAGIYALIGAFLAYKIVYANYGVLTYRNYPIDNYTILIQTSSIVLGVLILSISTAIWLTYKQAKKKSELFWNPASKRMLSNFLIPFLTGAVFIIVLILKGQFAMVAPTSLIFYGLALIFGSQHTFADIKWLGLCEIYLGLFAAVFPNLGILFWAVGFGILHIFYGGLMHFKYKQ